MPSPPALAAYMMSMASPWCISSFSAAPQSSAACLQNDYHTSGIWARSGTCNQTYNEILFSAMIYGVEPSHLKPIPSGAYIAQSLWKLAFPYRVARRTYSYLSVLLHTTYHYIDFVAGQRESHKESHVDHCEKVGFTIAHLALFIAVAS